MMLENFKSLALAAALIGSNSLGAQTDFVPLFNGRDFSGWVNVNCAPNTFTIHNGMIYCNGVPTGVMRTERQYENFELELDYRHLKPGGNSGLFVWSAPITAPGVPFAKAIEIQILDGRNSETYTSHGDVFSIHGATMKPDRPHPQGWARSLPSERRAKPAGEWNHYHVVCSNGVIKLAVNGKVVSGASECNPRKGYICLESEGGEIEFRDIRLKELPSTGATAEQSAPLDEGFKSLYSGIDLNGWKHEASHRGHWQPKDWTLHYDGKAEGPDPHLWSEKEYGDFVLICDWRWPGKGTKQKRPVIQPNGDYAIDSAGVRKEIEVDDAGDSGIYLRGSTKAEVNIWCWPAGSGEVYPYREDKSLAPEVRAAVTPKAKADKRVGEWNRFVITMKGDRLTVELNGQVVVENARLPGVPERGRLGLQHHGHAIEFANIFVKELK